VAGYCAAGMGIRWMNKISKTPKHNYKEKQAEGMYLILIDKIQKGRQGWGITK